MGRLALIASIVFLLTACGGGAAGGGPRAAAPPPPVGTATRTIQATPTDTLRAAIPTSTPYVGTATRMAETYSVNCTPAKVEAFLERFLDAFNRGDQAALRTFFPTVAFPTVGPNLPGGDYSHEKFVWYSMTDERLDFSKRHFVTFDLPPLWAYFAERHTHQERLRLARVQVSRQEADVANLEVNFYRTADDVPPDAGRPPGQAIGKAVMNCRDQTILVMSLGMGGGRGTPTP